jgi:hypothetical protein
VKPAASATSISTPHIHFQRRDERLLRKVALAEVAHALVRSNHRLDFKTSERLMTEINAEEYLRHFSQGRRSEALKQAHDIRKFEIGLYWKRAAYFWTFIAAAFAGYFVLQKEGEFASTYVITCLGFLFSLAWYYVNRGSGAWQRNWETHVDLLEDDITGPLYKTLINRGSYNFWHLAEPYSFSPSRINNILSLSVTFIWLFLIARTLWRIRNLLPIPIPTFTPSFSVTAIVMTLFTIVAALFLTLKGRARPRDKAPIDSIEFYVRTYRLPTHPPSAPR